MNRRIRVTGKGKISVKPDTICLDITAKGVYPDYDQAVEESAKQTATLRKAIQMSGLNPEDLKTSSFHIDAEYESYRDKNDNYKKRFVGYAYHHQTTIKFPLDNKQLGRTLFALAHCPVKTEFSMRYTVSDTVAVKNDLLKKAIADSTTKAHILAESAGVTLGSVISIDYSWGEVQIYSQPIREMRCFSVTSMLEKAPPSYDIDMEADDIDVTDTVTLEWEIE